jgi:hypothetical protein
MRDRANEGGGVRVGPGQTVFERRPGLLDVPKHDGGRRERHLGPERDAQNRRIPRHVREPRDRLNVDRLDERRTRPVAEDGLVDGVARALLPSSRLKAVSPGDIGRMGRLTRESAMITRVMVRVSSRPGTVATSEPGGER